MPEPAPRYPCPTGRHHAHPGLSCDAYEQWRRQINDAIKQPATVRGTPGIGAGHPTQDPGMNDADRKAWLAHHGIDTITVTDETGTTHQLLDETGMRALADSAPNPVRAHALVDQLLADARERHETA